MGLAYSSEVLSIILMVRSMATCRQTVFEKESRVIHLNWQTVGREKVTGPGPDFIFCCGTMVL